MKLFKIEITIKATPVYIYPFSFLVDWTHFFKLYYLEFKLARYFKKLKWTNDWVWSTTLPNCGSLDEAVELLAHKLTDNKLLLPKARRLIFNGYDRDWEY